MIKPSFHCLVIAWWVRAMRALWLRIRTQPSTAESLVLGQGRCCWVRTAERLRRLGFASIDQLTGVGTGSLRWLTAGLSPLRVDHGWLSAQACPAPSTGDPIEVRLT